MLGKLGDSEKRFVRQVERAVLHHADLVANGRVSKAPDEGRLAILHSYGTTLDSRYSADEQREIFKAEANSVSVGPLASHYADVEIRPVVNKHDVQFAVQDAEVAGIVVIGHGTLAAVRMPQEHFFNWRDAERATKQLKLGHFVQRMCGFMPIRHSLPLGTFVVADQRKIIAPPGVAIDDKYPDESIFQAIYPEAVNDVPTILALRDLYHAIRKSRYDEASDALAPDGILNDNE